MKLLFSCIFAFILSHEIPYTLHRVYIYRYNIIYIHIIFNRNPEIGFFRDRRASIEENVQRSVMWWQQRVDGLRARNIIHNIIYSQILFRFIANYIIHASIIPYKIQHSLNSPKNNNTNVCAWACELSFAILINYI